MLDYFASNSGNCRIIPQYISHTKLIFLLHAIIWLSKNMQPFHVVSFQTFCCSAWVVATLRKRLDRDAGFGIGSRRTEFTWRNQVQVGR